VFDGHYPLLIVQKLNTLTNAERRNEGIRKRKQKENEGGGRERERRNLKQFVLIYSASF
jgi:hypothetical protein